jgi:ribosomal protein S7
MIKSLKKNNTLHLKNKIANTLMKSGKKTTGEKILLKFFKSLQKSTNKNSKVLLQSAIINSTPAFKLTEQSIKKGKRKAKKNIPSFIMNDSLRIITALKLIKKVSAKNKNANYFYQSLVKEILASSVSKSQSVDQKNELHKQILINKRYLSKFRW